MEHFRDSKLYETDVTEALQNTGLDHQDITQIINYINKIIKRKVDFNKSSSFRYIPLYTSCPTCEERAENQKRQDIGMASLGVYAEYPLSDSSYSESSDFSESEEHEQDSSE